jgi:hypothetical protein
VARRGGSKLIKIKKIKFLKILKKNKKNILSAQRELQKNETKKLIINRTLKLECLQIKKNFKYFCNFLSLIFWRILIEISCTNKATHSLPLMMIIMTDSRLFQFKAFFYNQN